jgi:hypothetical protein
MAETPKVLSALLAQLPDNTTGLISPEDIRDAVVSLFPSRGQIDLTASAQTTFSGQNVWTKLAGTTALDATLGQDGFAQSTNNGLQATKAVNQVLLVVGNVEATCASNNKVFGFTFAKNGTAISTFHVSQRFDVGGSAYSVSFTALIPTVENDVISLYARNETDTTALTSSNLTLSAVGFIR